MATMRGRMEFQYGYHSILLNDSTADIWHWNTLNAMWELYEVMGKIMVTKARHMQQERENHAWISVHLPTVNGMEIGAQEWRDSVFLFYRVDPPDLPHLCDGCGEKLYITHGTDCKKGGLVTT